MKYNIQIVVSLMAIVALVQFARSEGSNIEDVRSALDASDWVKAKTLSERLIESEPGNGEAFHALGMAYQKLGDYKAAVDAYKESVKLVADNADYHADYGYSLVMRGQQMNMFQAGPVFMRAMDQYKTAVKLNPDHVGAHIGLARYYSNAPAIGGGSMKKAKEHAMEIARINSYLGYIEMALISQKENRYEDAEIELTAAIAMKSDDAWLHFELGKVQHAAGKLSEAKVAYEATLEIDPEHAGARAALAELTPVE